MNDIDVNNPALVLGTLLAGAAAKYCGLLWLSKAKEQKLQKIGRVSSLYLYPVKSVYGIRIEAGKCTKLGLRSNGATDRHWMVAKKNGQQLDMILEPRMALIHPSIHGDRLHLDAPNMETLILPVVPDKKTHEIGHVTIKGVTIDALDCGDKAAAWIKNFLNRPEHRLFHSDSSCEKRQSNTVPRNWKYDAKPEDRVAFSSFGPFMILSDASLAALNRKVEKTVPAMNFRPNIMVEGCGEFEEDYWKELRIGKAVFRPMDACTRCTMVTVDLSTGEKSKDEEPLKTLKKFRARQPYAPKPVFGRYFAVDAEGDIKINDDVYAVS